MKKIAFVTSLTLLFICKMIAQTHNSVPVTDVDLYRFLEMAEISGMIDPLPSTRPLTKSHVKSALQQMKLSKRKLSELQKNVLDDYIERYIEDRDKTVLLDGDLRLTDENFGLQWHFFSEVEGHVDLNDTNQYGFLYHAGGDFSGDLGRHFSYTFRLNGQANKIRIDNNAPYPYAWEPYTFTKTWDGGARLLSSPVALQNMPREWAFGWSFLPEIVFSTWENKINLRLGRKRHDWGYGEGNLFLDEQARPIAGLDGRLTPWKWISFSFLFGVLEYGPTFRNSPFVFGQYPNTNPADGGLSGGLGDVEVAKVQQNMISTFKLEIMPFNWLSVSLYETAIYLKRFEFGYLIPLMFKLPYQNGIGEYDNMLFGATINIGWPGLFRTYWSVLIDEWNPSIPIGELRNQLAVQAGIKVPIPMGVWSMVTFQYTKIEPFTYTHYALGDNPWYNTDPDNDFAMETGYQNTGENLGSYLEPNSDEFMLKFHIQPFQGFTGNFGYRLIRHGGDNVPGSTYDTWGYRSDNASLQDGDNTNDESDANGDPNGAYFAGGKKNFLKDGTYEWIHVFSLGASFDFSQFSVPFRLGLKYSFVYEYESDYGANSDFQAVDGSEVFRHLLSLTLTLWP